MSFCVSTPFPHWLLLPASNTAKLQTFAISDFMSTCWAKRKLCISQHLAAVCSELPRSNQYKPSHFIYTIEFSMTSHCVHHYCVANALLRLFGSPS